MKIFKLAFFVLAITLISISCRPSVYKNYDEFASCLDSKEVKFYGAFWCPHCQNQKKMFGGSDRLLPYIECSTPDGKGQNQVCKDAQIKSYPTWEFADGERKTGEVPLADLAAKTGCVLP